MCVQKCVCLGARVHLSFPLWRLGNIIILWPKGTDLPSAWIIEPPFSGINPQLPGWRSRCTTRDYDSNRRAGPATARSCSEVFLPSWFTDCKAFCVYAECVCVCVCDSVDVGMAHDGSYCCCSPSFSLFTWLEVLKKALITLKSFRTLFTLHTWLRLPPPPQLTRYIWQHRLLTTTEERGWVHLKQSKNPNKFTVEYLHWFPVATFRDGKIPCWHRWLSLSQRYEPLLVSVWVQAHGSDKSIFDSQVSEKPYNSKLPLLMLCKCNWCEHSYLKTVCIVDFQARKNIRYAESSGLFVQLRRFAKNGSIWRQRTCCCKLRRW